MRSALGAVLVCLLWFLWFPTRSLGTREENPRTRTTTRTIEDMSRSGAIRGHTRGHLRHDPTPAQVWDQPDPLPSAAARRARGSTRWGNPESPKLLLRDSREAGASEIVRSQAVYVLTERDEAGPHRPCVGGATDWPLPGASCQSQLSHRGKPGGGGALALRPYFNSSPGDAMAQSRRARRGRGVSEAARGGRRALGALPPNPQELSLYGHRHPHAAQMAEMPEAPMR